MRGLLFKRIIFVFQMGKVGSRSICFSIQKSLEEQDKGQGSWGAREIGDTILIHSHTDLGVPPSYKRMILWRAKLGLPLNVICPIREPIDRDVSAFFFIFVERRLNLLANASLRELKELFLTDSRPPLRIKPRINPTPANERIMEHQYILDWFDRYFRPLTRIDVYKEPFPIDRKWKIYRRGFTRVLLYRTDLKRSEQSKLISDFLDIKLGEMVSKNMARGRDYAKLYLRFRESVKLPEWYIGRMHNSRFAQHFWSQEELKAAANKWRASE